MIWGKLPWCIYCVILPPWFLVVCPKETSQHATTPRNQRHGVTLSHFPFWILIHAITPITNLWPFQLSTPSLWLPFLFLILHLLLSTSNPLLSFQNPPLYSPTLALFALSLAPCPPPSSKMPLEGRFPSSSRLPPLGTPRFSATSWYFFSVLPFWSLGCLSPASLLLFCSERLLGALLGLLGSSLLPSTLSLWDQFSLLLTFFWKCCFFQCKVGGFGSGVDFCSGVGNLGSLKYCNIGYLLSCNIGWCFFLVLKMCCLRVTNVGIKFVFFDEFS